MVWYNHWGWNCLKKTSSTVSDPFAKGLAYYCWQELPFFLAGSVKSRTERVWRLPTFSPIIFCLLRGHWGDNEVRCVLAVTLTQLRQDFSIQAIVLPIPFKSTKTKCIFFSYLFIKQNLTAWMTKYLSKWIFMPCAENLVNAIFTPCKHRAHVWRNFTRSLKADVLCLMPLTKF